MQDVINFNHLHGPSTSPSQEMYSKNDEKHTYSLLTDPSEGESTKFEDHDYDEPYFEPACTEEMLLTQLKSLNVSLLSKDNLRLVLV